MTKITLDAKKMLGFRLLDVQTQDATVEEQLASSAKFGKQGKTPLGPR